MRTLLFTFASRRLTIACMGAAIILITMMLLGQSALGFKSSIEAYFFSYVVTWIVPKTEIAIPFFPGGYTISILLALNLITSLITRIRFDVRRISLSIVYIGIILFIVSEFISSFQSEHSVMKLKAGESSWYSISEDRIEIALIDHSSNIDQDRVFTIPQEMIESEREVKIDQLPFKISVDRFLPNSTIVDRTPETSLIGSIASIGTGRQKTALPTPSDKKGNSSAYVTLYSDTEIIGTWLLNEAFDEQTFEFANTSYRISLRSERFYHPFKLALKDIDRSYYSGTNRLDSLDATLEVFAIDDQENEILSVSPGKPARIEELSLFINSRSLNDNSLILNISKQPTISLFIIATIVTSIGFLARLIAFLLVWLKENAKEAP